MCRGSLVSEKQVAYLIGGFTEFIHKNVANHFYDLIFVHNIVSVTPASLRRPYQRKAKGYDLVCLRYVANRNWGADEFFRIDHNRSKTIIFVNAVAESVDDIRISCGYKLVGNAIEIYRQPRSGDDIF